MVSMNDAKYNSNYNVSQISINQMRALRGYARTLLRANLRSLVIKTTFENYLLYSASMFPWKENTRLFHYGFRDKLRVCCSYQLLSKIWILCGLEFFTIFSATQLLHSFLSFSFLLKSLIVPIKLQFKVSKF